MIVETEKLFIKETKNIILYELAEKLNWKDKIIFKIFPNTCIKLFRNGMVQCFNYYNENSTF